MRILKALNQTGATELPHSQYSACFGAVMTSVRAINPKTWNEIYELIGRIQYRAIES